MRKYLWLVFAVFLILFVLYSRAFFIGKNGSESIDTPPAAHATIATTNNAVDTQSAQDVSFPPKDKVFQILLFAWPPFYMENDQGQWIGAVPEIIKPILNKMGYQVEFIGMPFARALEEMKGCKYPALAACVTGGGREEYILFSEPVVSIYSTLWKKKEDNRCWKEYDDLKGRNIGISPYHYGAGFLEAAEQGLFKTDLVTAKAPERIHFVKLLENKIDMFICELSVGNYLQKTHKPKFDEVDFCTTGVGSARPFPFAVSKAFFKENHEELHAFIENFNRELLSPEGVAQRKKIFNKYNMLIEMDEEGKIILPEGYEQPLQ